MPDRSRPNVRCTLYPTASQNEKWEEGFKDALDGRPSQASFYRQITDLRSAYASGYEYGAAYREHHHLSPEARSNHDA